MEIRPFRQEHIDEAGQLFKKRFTELRSVFPYLPKEVGKIRWITENLVEMVAKHPGFVAMQSSKLIGYMIGYPTIRSLKGSQCGAYVPEWGNATVTENDGSIYTDLYKAISRSWIDVRSYTHIVSFLANVTIDKTMSLLGFGMQVIDAVRNLSPPKVDTRANFAVGKTTEEQISQLRELDHLINKHLESAPIFLKRDSKEQDDNEIRRAFLSENTITIVATKKDQIISCIRGRMNHGNIPMLNQNGNFGIDFGYTREEYRNSKIATMVLCKAIEVASNSGASFCSVDFETQNAEGRHFWLNHFSPVVYSVMRKVDDRI